MQGTLSAYHVAQEAIAGLKAAILETLFSVREYGMSNAELGRQLGIYTGHKGHEGHISRTMLAIMEAECVVEQDTRSKRWRVRTHEAEG